MAAKIRGRLSHPIIDADGHWLEVRSPQNSSCMKSNGRLPPSDEEVQLDALMVKAALLKADLEKPQIEAGKLSELASELSDIQKGLEALKMFVK